MQSEEDPIEKCLEKARIGHPITKGEAIRALKRYQHVQHELTELQRHVDDPSKYQTSPKSTSQKLSESEETIYKLRAEIFRMKESRNHHHAGGLRPRLSGKSFDQSIEAALPSARSHRSSRTRISDEDHIVRRTKNSVLSDSTRLSPRTSEHFQIKPNLLSVMMNTGPYFMEAKTVVCTPNAGLVHPTISKRRSTIRSERNASLLSSPRKVDFQAGSENQLGVIESKFTDLNDKAILPPVNRTTTNRAHSESTSPRPAIGTQPDCVFSHSATLSSHQSIINPDSVTTVGFEPSFRDEGSMTIPSSRRTRHTGSTRTTRARVRFAETQPQSATSQTTSGSAKQDDRCQESVDVDDGVHWKTLNEVGSLSQDVLMKGSRGVNPQEAQIHRQTQTLYSESEENQASELTLITDDRKPMLLVETLGYIYNDEWQQAFQELTQLGKEEDQIFRLLSDILKEAYTFCVGVARTQMDELWRQQEMVLQTIIARPGLSQGGCKQRQQTTEGHTLLNREQLEETERYLKFYRQIMAGKSIPGVLEMFREKSFLTRVQKEADMTSLPETLEVYIDAVLACCWRISVMEASSKLTWLEPGVPMDKNRFTFYVVPGRTVKLTVWPAVTYGRTGTLLAKGVVVAT